jgi:hypothetical protein
MDSNFKENYHIKNDFRETWVGKEQTIHIFRKDRSFKDDDYYVGSIKYISYMNLFKKLKDMFSNVKSTFTNNSITK